MTPDEAKHLLLLHGPGTTDAAGEPLISDDGFLGSLRPYHGLIERNFHQVMEALLVVGDRLGRGALADREVVHAVWTICHFGRAWGLHPDGMLQRNRLITLEDSARLERWIDVIETTALRLLGGGSPESAVATYAEHVTVFGWGENGPAFVPLLGRTVTDPGATDEVGIIADALTRLGGRAREALPQLREAERREYTWYEPAARCTAEVREQIRRAITAIEGGQVS